MFKGFHQFLVDNAPIYATNIAFSNQKLKFDAAYNLVLVTVVNANADNSGYSTLKLTAKKAMAEEAALLCGLAYVCFENLGKQELSAQMHITETEYAHASDAQAATLAQTVYNVMNDNIALLQPDYVTAAQLAVLQQLITTFQNTHGTAVAVHQTNPADTAAFKSAIAQTDEALANLLILGKVYKATNPDFYTQLELASKMPPVNIHHTFLTVTVTAKEDASPVTGAVATLSPSGKTATGDANGIIIIEQVRNGNAELILTAPGHKAINMPLTIERGRDNAVSVTMEKAQ